MYPNTSCGNSLKSTCWQNIVTPNVQQRWIISAAGLRCCVLLGCLPYIINVSKLVQAACGVGGSPRRVSESPRWLSGWVG